LPVGIAARARIAVRGVISEVDAGAERLAGGLAHVRGRQTLSATHARGFERP
jgi:hypothetical protein